MIDLFDFPDYYKVKKQLTVSHYLSSASITENEKKTIKRYVKDISILYDIKCADQSELIIIAVDVDKVTVNEQLERIAIAITSSIPHDVLVAVFVGNNARLFSFVTDNNSVNDNRKRVKRISSTDLFTADHPELYIEETLTEIKNTPFIAKSSADLLNYWFRLIRNYRESFKEKKRQRMLDESYYEKHSDNYLQSRRESFIPQKTTTDESEELRKDSIKCMCAFAHPLYDEYEKQRQYNFYVIDNEDFYDVDKDDWLTMYIDLCNTILVQEFDQEISEEETNAIHISYYELDDPQDLRKYMQIPIERMREYLDQIYIGMDPFPC